MKKIYFLIAFSLLMAMNASAAPFWNTFDVVPSASWTVDRYAPAAFESASFLSDNRLHISITQDKLDRPAAYQSGFYNTHGKQIQTNVSNPSVMRGKLFIPASWETNHRRSDIWGVLADAANAVTDYPIIGFGNTTGSNPTFRVWDQDDANGWVNVSYTINYDEWYNFEVVFTSTEYKYYINGTLVYTDMTVDATTTQLKSIIVQGYNFGDADLSSPVYNDDYDIYWDDVAVYPQGYNVVNLTQNTVYNTIQSAINAANAGDEIEAAAGTYTELLNINKANLTIRGAGSSSTTLNTSSAGSGYGVKLSANGVTFKGFNIIPSSSVAKNGYTIHASNTPNVISGLTLEDIVIDATSVANLQRTGVDLHGIDNAVLNDIAVSGCDYGNGVSLTGCTNASINNVTTSGNAWGGLAIYVSKYTTPNRASSNLTFDFAQNNIGEFVYVEDQYGLVNTNIIIQNYTYGMNNMYATATTGNFTLYTNKTLNDAVLIAAGLNVKFSNSLSYCWDAGLANYWVGTGMSIQAAIDAASAGNTVNVLAGTYAEDLVVNKALDIRGANYGINPNTGSRIAEAIIVPATSNPDISTGGQIMYLENAASGSSINGFTFNGDNPLLTSGVFMYGADVDVLEAISAYHGLSNVTVSNNIVKNLNYAGIDFYNYYNSGNATTGNLIENNLFENIKPSQYGIAVLIYNNCYTKIINNVMTDVRVGVQTGNFYKADPGNSRVIDNNLMNVSRRGIFHNLAYSSASEFTLSNNLIAPSANGVSTEWDGILLSSLSVPSSSLNNNITGSSTVPSQAYELWNVKSNAPAYISGGTLSNVDYGVFANNWEGYNSNGGDGAHATVENIQINPKSTGTGIYLHDNPSSTHANVQVIVGNGVAIENCANAVVIENTNAKLVSIGDNFNLDGISGDYFKLINNAYDIDATNVNFDGKKGSDMNLVELYAVESKLVHKVDNSALGLITINSNTDASISLSYNYVSPIWVDNNSANSNATLPSGATAPNLNANDADFNNNNSVSFAGGTNILSIPYNNNAARLNGNTAKSFFTFFKTGANISTRQVIFEAGGISSGYNVYVYRNRVFLGVWNSTQRRYFYIGAATNTNYFVSIEYGAGKVRVSLNGITSGYQTFTGFTTETSENGVGGSYNRTRYMDNISALGITHTLTGKIAEILCYNSNTKALRDEVIDYIDAKYGTNFNSNYSGKMVASNETVDSYSWDEGDVEYSSENGLSVSNYDDNIEITYITNESQPGKLSLYDLNGQSIKTIYNDVLKKGINTFNIETSDISSGLYFMVVETNYGLESKKVVIVK